MSRYKGMLSARHTRPVSACLYYSLIIVIVLSRLATAVSDWIWQPAEGLYNCTPEPSAQIACCNNLLDGCSCVVAVVLVAAASLHRAVQTPILYIGLYAVSHIDQVANVCG